MPHIRTLRTRWHYVLAGGSVALLTLVLLQLPTSIVQSDIALVYLLLVLIYATTFGRGPAVLASLLAFLASNYFFVLPRYSLSVTQPTDILRLTTFLLVAISTSGLAGRVRQQAALAQEQAAELAALYTLSQTISAAVDLNQILPVIAQTTAQLLDVPSCQILLVNQHGVMVERASFGAEQPPVRRVDTPLRVGARVLGVLRVSQNALNEPLPKLAHEQLQLIAGQVILTVERARLAQEANAAHTLVESDRLKSVLLTSVSHDFRTPLAVIKGAVTNMLDDDVPWDVETRREFLSAINTETDRLNRQVGNLLEMARIEGHALSSARTWQDVDEVVQMVVARMQPLLSEHPLTVSVAPKLPLLPLNVTQIDQIITNLLENAALHTPPQTGIEIEVQRKDAMIQIIVRDAGPGIPPGMTERIFERFVRATGPERHATGSGLGLAIARGLAQAHGGWLRAENRPTGGAQFLLTLPIPASETEQTEAHITQKAAV